MVNGSNINN